MPSDGSGPGRSEDSFVHLHVHTEYSMLDGAAKIDDLFAEAARMGMPALATTDHGFVFGAYEFWKKAQKYGVKPIIGVEAYLTPGTSRFDRTRVRWGEDGEDDVSGGGAYTHLTLLAETTGGMHNLFRMTFAGVSLEGHFYKPRMDRELLSTYSKGLIATTGCPGGEVQTRLRLGQYREAVDAAAELRDIFGPSNYYCELMDHGLPVEKRVREDLLRLARDLQLPLLATQRPALHPARGRPGARRPALRPVRFHARRPEAVQVRRRRLLPQVTGRDARGVEGAARGLRQHPADRRALRGDVHRGRQPDAALPGARRGRASSPGSSRRSSVACTGATRAGCPTEARKQADFEVDVICQMGFPGYFLVVADFINWAKEQGIRVGPGRGSAAGSLAAYATGITDLDPLRHGLIFERFLNPERVSMPDVDVDFDERRRGEVIRYVSDRYGEDRVAQIVTYGTIKAKQALKDASRVLGYPFSMGERLTKAMPPAVMGKDIPLTGIFDPAHPRHGEAE